MSETNNQKVTQLPSKFTHQNTNNAEQTLRTLNAMLLMIKALQRDVNQLSTQLNNT